MLQAAKRIRAEERASGWIEIYEHILFQGDTCKDQIVQILHLKLSLDKKVVDIEGHWDAEVNGEDKTDSFGSQ